MSDNNYRPYHAIKPPVNSPKFVHEKFWKLYQTPNDFTEIPKI